MNIGVNFVIKVGVMASAEREPITGVGGAPRGLGAEPPEAENSSSLRSANGTQIFPFFILQTAQICFLKD